MLPFLPNIHVVSFVPDGGEAIAYLGGIGPYRDRQKFPFPDLLLLDLRMPVCDGLQVLAFLKGQPLRPRVVLWSNSLAHLDETRALRLGADLVCQKPHGLQEFAETLTRIESQMFLEYPEPAPEQKTISRQR
jgi:CheY-like chemotaxis protein